MSVDVMMKMPELPEGWEYTGEVRVPVRCEWFSSKLGVVEEWYGDTVGTVHYPIVRRVENWRPATIEDAVRAIRGEKVVARFRTTLIEWRKPSRLCAYSAIPSAQWCDANGYWWNLCEVLECN